MPDSEAAFPVAAIAAPALVVVESVVVVSAASGMVVVASVASVKFAPSAASDSVAAGIGFASSAGWLDQGALAVLAPAAFVHPIEAAELVRRATVASGSELPVQAQPVVLVPAEAIADASGFRPPAFAVGVVTTAIALEPPLPFRKCQAKPCSPSSLQREMESPPPAPFQASSWRAWLEYSRNLDQVVAALAGTMEHLLVLAKSRLIERLDLCAGIHLALALRLPVPSLEEELSAQNGSERKVSAHVWTTALESVTFPPLRIYRRTALL